MICSLSRVPSRRLPSVPLLSVARYFIPPKTSRAVAGISAKR